jgi:hypothetical protein
MLLARLVQVVELNHKVMAPLWASSSRTVWNKMGRGHSTGKLEGANVPAAVTSLSHNKSSIFLPHYLICKSPLNTTVHSKIPLIQHPTFWIS